MQTRKQCLEMGHTKKYQSRRAIKNQGTVCQSNGTEPVNHDKVTTSGLTNNLFLNEEVLLPRITFKYESTSELCYRSTKHCVLLCNIVQCCGVIKPDAHWKAHCVKTAVCWSPFSCWISSIELNSWHGSFTIESRHAEIQTSFFIMTEQELRTIAVYMEDFTLNFALLYKKNVFFF